MLQDVGNAGRVRRWCPEADGKQVVRVVIFQMHPAGTGFDVVELYQVRVQFGQMLGVADFETVQNIPDGIRLFGHFSFLALQLRSIHYSSRIGCV